MKTDKNTAPPLDRQVLIVAGIVTMAAAMTVLDTTIVSVAIRTLGHDLKVSLDTIQWVSTAYTLALASVIPLAGWGSDRFGIKRVWIASLLLFILGSVLSGLAWSAASLIVFRVVQGIGGGILYPTGLTLLMQAAGPKRIGRVMAIISVPLMLGPILGPVLGGALVTGLSWRWIFYINVPVGAIALVLSWSGLASEAPRRAERLDVRGLVLLPPGLALFVYALSRLSASGGLGSPVVLACGLSGVVLLAAFAVHAMSAEHPLLDLRLLRKPAFMAASLINVVAGAAMIGSMLLLPLYYQAVRGASPLAAGLLVLPQGAGAALVQPISGILVDRGRAGLVVLTGLTVMALGYITFTQLGPGTSYILLCAALVVMGMGAGCTVGPVMAAGLAPLDRRAVPRASSTLNVSLRVGGAVGTALFAVVLQQDLTHQLGGSYGTGLSAVVSIPPRLRPHVAAEMATAFAHSFWWPLIITALAIPAALLLPRRRAPELASARPGGTRSGPADTDQTGQAA
jgi:EmrB/QacA subfamily drug resistance transporter